MNNFTVKSPVRCIGTDLFIEDLDHLKVEIDLKAYIEIKRLHNLVSAAGDFALLTVDSPGWYEPCDEDGKGSEYREDGAEMTVRDRYIFFAGYEKHTDIRWECDAINISELDAHFIAGDAE